MVVKNRHAPSAEFSDTVGLSPLDNIKSALAHLENARKGIERQALQSTGKISTDTELLFILSEIYRVRTSIFGSDLFGDPAWMIMLELYKAHNLGRNISITTLCISTNAPATTALRWIKILESRDLIVRVIDPDDSRRSFVKIHPDAYTRMKSMIDTILGN